MNHLARVDEQPVAVINYRGKTYRVSNGAVLRPVTVRPAFPGQQAWQAGLVLDQTGHAPLAAMDAEAGLSAFAQAAFSQAA